MRRCLELSNDEIGDIFKDWNEHGGLQGNFLVDLASELPHFKKGDAIKDSKGIVDDIQDKVVQDADDSEGTGFWTMRVSCFVKLKTLGTC
jgi:6-phosphogluconate dehydrogenase